MTFPPVRPLRKTLLICCFLGLGLPGLAQRLQIADLLRYLGTSPGQFDMSMFRQGFVCYQNTLELQGWTCLFAYQPIPYLAPPDQATAVIQYVHNTRSDVIVYQVRSTERYRNLVNELGRLGYRMESTPGDRCIYSRDNTVISCQQTDKNNGISGNYQGHTITLIRRSY